MKSIAGALFGFRCFDSLESAARVDRRGDIPGHFKIGHQLQHPAMKMGSALLALMCGTMLTSTGHAVPQSDDHVLQPAGGDQLPGLSPEEITRYLNGKVAYGRNFEEGDGLGPIFNSTSCRSCHGANGGSGSTKVTVFGQLINGVFDPMEEFGGPVKQDDANVLCDVDEESIPDEATIIRQRVTLGSMGYGLIQALTNDQIAANEIAQNEDMNDSVSGRVHWVTAIEDDSQTPMAGRFGWKAQLPTVESFSIDAAFNELGLTSPRLPHENTPGGPAGTNDCDVFPTGAPDTPDLNSADTYLLEVADFQRLMAPPSQSPTTHPGELLFTEIGCAECHTPSYITPDDPNLEPALRNVEIRPYSDFLLHDMPTIEDGIVTGNATGSEFRTPALWGLRNRFRLMHNGSVTGSSPEQRAERAILKHGPGGEAAMSKAQYELLSDAEQDELLDFLGTLGRPDFDLDGNGARNQDDIDDALTMIGRAEPGSNESTGDLDNDGALDAFDVSALYRSTGQFIDCNQNGSDDIVDIEIGLSDDENENGIPDECEELPCGVRIIRITGDGGDIPDNGGKLDFLETNAIISGETSPIIEARLTLVGFQHPWMSQLAVTLTHESDDANVDDAFVSPFFLCGRKWDLIGSYGFRDDTTCEICDEEELCSFDNPIVTEGSYLMNPDAQDDNTFGAQFADGIRLPNGTWTLKVQDFESGEADGSDVGQLGFWTLDLYVFDSTVGADSDADGTPDCIDNCPNDPLKVEPGDCGCGAQDTDSDSDGTADCIDDCPNDPLKVEPGICDCGVQDTDSDSDGTADCIDNCPNDPLKVVPGDCGCGVQDTDSDSDGTADCIDGCPDDVLKTEAGVCGCGIADTDTDADGTADCIDGCPDDVLKTEAGVCGCGIADTDTDADGTADCIDGCPDDVLKTDPGVCGCGIADTDTDADGTADCNDGCPDDVLKTDPGQCGCGVAETDTDSDGTADCNDGCPDDVLKTDPGQCGCGVAETDSDSDGTADCNDNCPNDPFKVEPGLCGCGLPETPNCEGPKQGEAVQWRLVDGGNDHWYALQLVDRTWDEASQDAANLGGHLATLTTQAENDWVFAEVANAPDAWNEQFGPWIGGFQNTSSPDYSEPGGGWEWVTGEPWAFTNWQPNDPSNTGGAQNFLALSGTSPSDPIAPLWNDLSNEPIASIIEWSADCNNDGFVDYGQIQNGTLVDLNDNGIPDSCEVEFIGFEVVPSMNGDYTVVDVHAVYDNSEVVVLNMFERSIVTKDGQGFHHSDIQTFSGNLGSWKPTDSIVLSGSEEPNPEIDSFITIGGGVGDEAALNDTALDPGFSIPTGPFVPAGAGWYDSNPFTAEQVQPFNGGYTELSGSSVLVGRFVFETARLSELSDSTDFFSFNGQSGANSSEEGELFYGIGSVSFPDDRDCDQNGIADYLEIAEGTALDCNNNFIPDACEIADGTLIDSNGNGLPDECEPQFAGFEVIPSRNGDYTVLDVHAVYDDTEVVVLNMFGRSILTKDQQGFHHNDIQTFTGNLGSWKPTDSIEIPGQSDPDPTVDSFVTIAGGVGSEAPFNETTLDPGFGDGIGPNIPIGAGWFDSNPPTTKQVQPFAGSYTGLTGSSVLVGRFVFETARLAEFSDSTDFFTFNGESGAKFTTTPDSPILFGIGSVAFPDDRDCDQNGVSDYMEIADGTAEDCNGNFIPDACEIADGTLIDTDGDGLVDDCDPCPTWPGACSEDGQTFFVTNKDGPEAPAEALSLIPSGGVVSLGAGTFLLDATLDTNGKAVTIRGTTDINTGAPLTVLDGQNTHRVLQCLSGEGADTLFENLIVQNGLGQDAEINGEIDNLGGGMLNRSSNPTIQNCLFRDNTADLGGGLCNHGSSAVITDCTFTMNSSSRGGGLYNFFSDPTFSECTFESNDSEIGGAVYNYNTQGVQNYTNCDFTGNNATDKAGAVYNFQCAPMFANCLFDGNVAQVSGGAMRSLESQPTLDTCTFINNSTVTGSGGAIFNNQSTATLNGCTITENTSFGPGGGIRNFDSTATILGTTVCSNTPNQITGDFTDDGGNCISEVCDSDLDGTFDCIDLCPDDATKTEPGDCGCGVAETDTDGDGTPDCIDPCPTWPGTCSEDGQSFFVTAEEGAQGLALAFTEIPDGGLIEIAAGTFLLDATLDTNGKAVTIRGATDISTGEPLTLLDGQNTHRVLQCLSGEGADTLFENLIVQNGLGQDAEINGEIGNLGGGMLNRSSNPTIQNCLFRDNTADFGGGLCNHGSSAVITDCTFTMNSSSRGGGLYNFFSDPTLSECTFESNDSEIGGAVYNYNTQGVQNYTNCDFTGNNATDKAGAVYNFQCAPMFANCLFDGNVAQVSGGAMRSLESQPTLDTCTFINNSTVTGSGGAIFNNQSSATLNGCTITENTSFGPGGGIRNFDSTATILGTTVCSNTPNQITGDFTDDGGNCISEVCDSDLDGTFDCIDLCPDDATKTEPGDCGCGVAETDTDGDGTPDCIDPCPTWPGSCSGDGQTIVIQTSDGLTINAAIDAAPDGGTVLIGPGIWNETIDFGGRALTIEVDSGLGADVTILDGTGLAGPIISFVNGEGPDSVVRGLTFTNATTGSNAFGQAFTIGGAIFINEASPLIDDCVFTDNAADFGGAIYARLGAPTIQNCAFMNNSATNNEGGALQFTNSLGTITNCTFSGNVSGGLGGAVHAFGGAPTISSSVFTDNISGTSGGAISWGGFGGTLLIENCELTGNDATSGTGGGLYINPEVDAASENTVTLRTSTLCGNTPDQVFGSVYLDEGDNCISEFCDADEDGTPDCDDLCPDDPDKTEPGDCGCGVSEVDSDSDGTPDCLDNCPDDAEKTEPGECGCGVADTDTDSDGTPDCLDNCPTDSKKTEPGDCGCGVAETDTDADGTPDCIDPCPTWAGTCSEDGQTIIVMTTDGLTINEAIAAAPDGGTVQVGPGTWNETIDFGGRALTIESGSGLGAQVTILDGTGLDGPIISFGNEEGPDSVLRGFTLENATSGSTELNPDFTVGGAIFIFESSPVIEDCVFRNNNADYGGAVYTLRSMTTIRNCAFTSNTSNIHGGGLQFSNSNALAVNCTFIDNVSGELGGAIHAFQGASTISECLITDNLSGTSGGGISWGALGGTLLVENCTVANNAAFNGEGGGLYISTKPETESADTITIAGSSLCNNAPDQIAGATYIDGGGNQLCGCTGDISFDGVVDGQDITIMLSTWGVCDSDDPLDCLADFDGNGIVNGADLTTILSNWGVCSN